MMRYVKMSDYEKALKLAEEWKVSNSDLGAAVNNLAKQLLRAEELLKDAEIYIRGARWFYESKGIPYAPEQHWLTKRKEILKNE